MAARIPANPVRSPTRWNSRWEVWDELLPAKLRDGSVAVVEDTDRRLHPGDRIVIVTEAQPQSYARTMTDNILGSVGCPDNVAVET